MVQLKLLTFAVLVLTSLMPPALGDLDSDIQQFATETKDLAGDISKFWDPVAASYNKLITDYVRRTFGRGTMNMFMVLHTEQNLYKITEGFIASDPECAVTLDNLILNEIPLMKQLSVNVTPSEMFLKASAVLERVVIKGHYALYREKGVVDSYAAGEHSPFSYQEVMEEGDVTIVGYNCEFTGGGTLTMVAHTLSMENPHFHVRGCYYELEISTPYTGNGPVFAPYFDNEQKKHLNLLLSQPIRRTFVMRVNNALYSTINITNVVGAETSNKMRELCKLSTSIARNIFGKMHKKLREALVADAKPSVQVANFINRFNTIEIEGLHGTSVELSDVVVGGLDSSMSAGPGATHVCSSHPGEMHVSEMSSFRLLQVSGVFKYLEVGAGIALGMGTFTANARNVRLSCDLSSPLSTRRDSKLTLSLFNLTLLGWNQLEMSVFGKGVDEKMKSHIKASLAGYCNKAITAVIDNFYEKALPVILKNFNEKDPEETKSQPAYKRALMTKQVKKEKKLVNPNHKNR